MDKKVYVLILNWNGKHHLEYCLPSVTQSKYNELEIVVIDNKSSDDSLLFIRQNFPEVTVLETGANLGYAGGNNYGIRYALEQGADYIVLLNSDMEVDSRWLREAVIVAEARPRVGMIGFATVGEYRQNEDPDRKHFHELSAAWQETIVEPTDHITGCALLMRAEVLENVGLIDEAYYAYGEEDDLLNRAMRAGYEQVRINVPAWHYNGGSWGRRARLASYLAMRNNIRFLLKNRTPNEIWQQTSWLVRFVCTRHVEYEKDIPHFRRLRASTYFVNVALLATAFVWNLLFLPVTLWRRYQDEQQITVARQLLDQRYPRSKSLT